MAPRPLKEQGPGGTKEVIDRHLGLRDRQDSLAQDEHFGGREDNLLRTNQGHLKAVKICFRDNNGIGHSSHPAILMCPATPLHHPATTAPAATEIMGDVKFPTLMVPSLASQSWSKT